MEPDLVLRDVRKTFGRTVAVDAVSMTVMPGEFVALLGPPGCGKTTTLRIVAGFERPDRGQVLIKGVPVIDRPPYRRDVGLVFQSYALFPHMTVSDNVAYGLRMRRLPRAEVGRRVEETLRLVELPGLGERYPRQLSGGQQQRVAVARAIVIRPSLLLLDEPLSNLDARLRQTMRDELRELQRTLGIATILVTHNQEEALSLADRIVVMNAGRGEQVGSPEDVYERPASRFVAGFIGQCNFLDGRIVSADGEIALFAAEGGLSFRIACPGGIEGGRVGTVGIRPELIRVLTGDARPAGGANVATGTVRRVRYLGVVRKYRIVTDAGIELLVDQPAGLDPEGDAPPTEGATVCLAWSPLSCQWSDRGVEPPARRGGAAA